VLEGAIEAIPILNLDDRSAANCSLWTGDAPEEGEAIGRAEGERPQQRRFDDAEDRGAGADGESERPDDRDGERRLSPKRAEREAEILQQVFQGASAGREHRHEGNVNATWRRSRKRRSVNVLSSRASGDAR
jgi:hypothetical protein